MLTPLPPHKFNKYVDTSFSKIIDYLDTKKGKLNISDMIEYSNKDGTYLFTRQKPTQEIWVSSPKSGSWKFFFDNGFFCKGKSLNEFVESEIDD